MMEQRWKHSWLKALPVSYDYDTFTPIILNHLKRVFNYVHLILVDHVAQTLQYLSCENQVETTGQTTKSSFTVPLVASTTPPIPPSKRVGTVQPGNFCFHLCIKIDMAKRDSLV